jgi:hypothetical protein
MYSRDRIPYESCTINLEARVSVTLEERSCRQLLAESPLRFR